MSELQVNDLSFCESANNEQVQGGYSPPTTNGPIVSSLSYSKVFDTAGGDETFTSGTFPKEFLSEQELSKAGKLGYRIYSKDGKKFIGGFAGKKGDANIATSYARVKS
ncbi:MAG: hypothetical protein KME64_23090 [Scytonematopsis contorta HA4267-MV1]|jgi:hypothetical protein|nr:hypothetical protein [Scytonematopsis contorta HA4267-MV1]